MESDQGFTVIHRLVGWKNSGNILTMISGTPEDLGSRAVEG